MAEISTEARQEFLANTADRTPDEAFYRRLDGTFLYVSKATLLDNTSTLDEILETEFLVATS